MRARRNRAPSEIPFQPRALVEVGLTPRRLDEADLNGGAFLVSKTAIRDQIERISSLTESIRFDAELSRVRADPASIGSCQYSAAKSKAEQQQLRNGM